MVHVVASLVVNSQQYLSNHDPLYNSADGIDSNRCRRSRELGVGETFVTAQNPGFCYGEAASHNPVQHEEHDPVK